MNLLALDSATDACSVALSVQGELHELWQEAPRQHNELLMPMAEQLLSAHGMKISELDGVVFGMGPGSFTGIRLAAGMAQGMGLASGLPVYAVSDFMAISNRYFHSGEESQGSNRVAIAMDARMNQYAWAVYSVIDNDIHIEQPEVLIDSAGIIQWYDEACAQSSELALLGQGWATEALAGLAHGSPMQVDPAVLPHAADMVRLVQQSPNAYLSRAGENPLYLREQVAVKRHP